MRQRRVKARLAHLAFHLGIDICRNETGNINPAAYSALKSVVKLLIRAPMLKLLFSSMSLSRYAVMLGQGEMWQYDKIEVSR